MIFIKKILTVVLFTSMVLSGNAQEEGWQPDDVIISVIQQVYRMGDTLKFDVVTEQVRKMEIAVFNKAKLFHHQQALLSVGKSEVVIPLTDFVLGKYTVLLKSDDFHKEVEFELVSGY